VREAFPDPQEFKDEKEFAYAALASSALKKSVVEIIAYVEGMANQAKHLDKKKKGQIVDKFAIGK
jgi:hypothetical protein